MCVFNKWLIASDPTVSIFFPLDILFGSGVSFDQPVRSLLIVSLRALRTSASWLLFVQRRRMDVKVVRIVSPKKTCCRV